MSTHALQKAIDYAGGQSALGRKINRDQKAIWAWLNTTGKVPAEDVLSIEEATNGEVTRHDLRPDIYPNQSNDSAPQAATAPLNQIIIQGGKELNGTIKTSGAKNAALKLMCTALLTEESLYLDNMPNALRDIASQTDLLEHLGCTISAENDLMAINAKTITTLDAPYDLVRKMRTSILVLGPLLSRFGEAHVSLPGGCAIGGRPIDMHLKALEQMGATILLEDGYVKATVPNKGRLQGAAIAFPKVSVGATENLMMAATLAEGTTTLANAAREPEIVDIGECLIKMGAKITGLGTSTITIEGVKALHSARHSVVADRIEAGTYMMAVAMTGGKLTITNTRPEHLTALITPMKSMGIAIETTDTTITVSRDKSKPITATSITTQPYPDFPTDLQAQFMAMLTQCEGTGLVTETIFENRFMHVPELTRMGANITVDGNTATVHGNADTLKGAPVMATDLRASVALVMAGLVAEGETIVNRIYHLERGYEDIAGKLSACGVDIKRV